VQLVALAPDDLWAGLRAPILAELNNSERRDAFWSALPAALAQDIDGRLQARILADPRVRQHLCARKRSGRLENRDPLLDPLLRGWAEEHESQFTPDSSLLLDAATHTLPQIRTWGWPAWNRSASTYPSPCACWNLACRPPSGLAAASSSPFQSVTSAKPSFTLALCDSPQPTVRVYGRDFATRRLAKAADENGSPRSVARPARRLLENNDPATQTFVADNLHRLPPDARPANTDAWDAEVLRASNRSRPAKERIKARRMAPAAELLPDVATLLDLARGGTSRDAEWALAQLARRAVAGEPIEGVTVEGVVGV
jgi:hypothetical protein